MKKSLVALAALAVSGAAMAQVTITGRANLDVGSYSAVGASGNSSLGVANTVANPSAIDFASRNVVRDASSRITLTVNEDLGGGRTAGLVCDTGINIDTATNNGQAFTANANTNTFCSREGSLRFGTETAQIRLGRQNVFWTSGAADATGSNLVGNAVISNFYGGGVGLLGTRLPNMIMLHGGKNLGKFANSQLYYGINEAGYGESSNNFTGGNIGTGTQGTGTYNGFKLTYAINPTWEAMIDYQSAQNTTPTAAGATAALVSSFNRTATKYQLAWKYAGGESIASLQYWNKERVDNTAANTFSLPTLISVAANGAATAGNNTGANSGSGKDSGVGLNVNHDFGDGYVGVLQYVVAYNMQGVQTANAAPTEIANSGATGYTVGGIMRMSKRTHAYVAYNSIINGVNAQYGFSGGNYQSSTAANGQQITTTAIGLQHWF
jgi:hypothetical protein